MLGSSSEGSSNISGSGIGASAIIGKESNISNSLLRPVLPFLVILNLPSASPRLVLSAAGVPIEESMVGNTGVAEAADEFSATCGKSEMNFKITVLECKNDDGESMVIAGM